MAACACNPSTPESGAEAKADHIQWSPDERALIDSLSPLPPLPPSPTNRFADNEQARDLGHKLFFDTRLSANGRVSCSTCHVPEMYFTDGLSVGKGIGLTRRHTPTLMGPQWAPFLLWDGRADSVWSQAVGPLENPDEHGLTRVGLAKAVFDHHRKDYEAVFGPMPPLDDTERFIPTARPVPSRKSHPQNMSWGLMLEDDRKAVNTVVANVGKALEAYQRVLVPGPAPFDRYVEALGKGDPSGGGHLSKAAQRGLRAFVGKGQCINCHNTPLMTDMGFHNLGLTPTGVVAELDLGRSRGAADVLSAEFNCQGAFSDTKECQELRFLNPVFEDFLGAFKTPTLRNVAKTAPYMHTGQFKSLAEVVTFYRTLPGKAVIGHRELVLSLLDRSIETGDLVAFLETLTGDLPDKRWLAPPPEAGARLKPKGDAAGQP